jgi:hypothetical protein
MGERGSPLKTLLQIGRVEHDNCEVGKEDLGDSCEPIAEH